MSKIKMLFCSLLCLNLAFAQVQNMKKDDFFKAVKESNIDKIQYFLEGGFDINAKDERGRNAILIATYKDDVKLVKFLYQNGGDVNDRDENLNSAFLYAGANGKLEILKIIHKRAKVNSVFNRFGGNALIPACEKGHFETYGRRRTGRSTWTDPLLSGYGTDQYGGQVCEAYSGETDSCAGKSFGLPVYKGTAEPVYKIY